MIRVSSCKMIAFFRLLPPLPLTPPPPLSFFLRSKLGSLWFWMTSSDSYGSMKPSRIRRIGPDWPGLIGCDDCHGSATQLRFFRRGWWKLDCGWCCSSSWCVVSRQQEAKLWTKTRLLLSLKRRRRSCCSSCCFWCNCSDQMAPAGHFLFSLFSLLKKNTCLFCTILGYFDSSTFFFNCVRLILYGIRRDLICLVSTDYSNAMDDFQLFFWRVDYYYQRFSVLIILFCDYFCWVGYLKSPVLVLSLTRFSTSRVNSSSLTILLLTDCSVQDSVHHSRCSEDSLGFWNIINIFKNHNIIVKRRRRSSIWWQMRSFDSDPSRRTNNQSRTFTKDMTGSIFVLSFSLAPFFSVIFHGRRMLADSSGFPFCEFCEICEFSNGFYSI